MTNQNVKRKMKSLLAVLALLVLAVFAVGENSENFFRDEVSKNDSIFDRLFSSSDTEFYEVIKIVDGDTIDVRVQGKEERVRLIGINTPETVDPNRPVECFGAEASNRAKALLTGMRVRLEADTSQQDRDKHGRLLRYLFLEDGTNVGEIMVEEGYAYEYTYDLPYKYQSEFKTAQETAQSNSLGLWGDVCAK